jgi:hypothetical protein
LVCLENKASSSSSSKKKKKKKDIFQIWGDGSVVRSPDAFWMS